MALALLRTQKSPMPGFGLGMGITLTMLSLIVILPIGALLAKGISYGPAEVWTAINTPRVWAALYLSFRLAFLAAVFNLIFGTLLAWVLARYDFPGRRVVDALVDLPFALPTAVAGIALTALYAPNGVFGSIAKSMGQKIAYTEWGILIALIFVGLPFVTRTVQPVI
ncbi:MAG TPA: sulfate ABC transporter permease subunit CysT, partial [Paracoccus sp. (in: a-proteobacteria)]|uniref:ABC transporter permease n=1 Tax=Paracoccus sp. TaxID=267 RepID=UPI002B5C38D3|nr:sulfate ABC transporter permease subunit CysT [Paracoccus sp. (in: a-proteobacteria)]